MRRRLFLILVLLLLIPLAFAIYSYFRSRERLDELVLYGNVDVRQVDIGFRVAGQVEQLLFEEGDWVSTGKLMAKLNITPYTSQVKQAEANIASTQASLENAEKLLKRRQELITTEAVSQEDLDTAQANRDIYWANLVAAQAAQQVALDNLAYTEAFAPTDGIILSRVREPGTVVNPADPVYVLSVASPVWIRAYVGEPDLGRVFFGMTATIFTDTEEAPHYTGRVGFISPVAEFTPKTVQTTELRTDLVYRLRIYVDNPDGFLKQGMPVTVKLRTDREQ